MKIYTIAQETHEVYGHGSCGTELRICKAGAYGTGEFPPCFDSYKQAAVWLAEQEYIDSPRIVELDLL